MNITVTHVIEAAPALMLILSTFADVLSGAHNQQVSQNSLAQGSTPAPSAMYQQGMPSASVPAQPPTFSASAASMPVNPAISGGYPPAAAPQTAATAPYQVIQPQQALPTAMPTAAPSYTMEQLALAATQLVDAGKRTELVGILNQFGVDALTALPKEYYGAFANNLRGMGVKI